MRRTIRKIFRVRSWSKRTKLAVGVWIPVIVVAIALVTGPNRSATPADAASDSTPTTERVVPKATPRTTAPTTVPYDVILGEWLKGIHPGRARHVGLGGRHTTSPLLSTTQLHRKVHARRHR
jgi:hypothetical protein